MKTEDTKQLDGRPIGQRLSNFMKQCTLINNRSKGQGGPRPPDTGAHNVHAIIRKNQHPEKTTSLLVLRRLYPCFAFGTFTIQFNTAARNQHHSIDDENCNTIKHSVMDTWPLFSFFSLLSVTCVRVSVTDPIFASSSLFFPCLCLNSLVVVLNCWAGGRVISASSSFF